MSKVNQVAKENKGKSDGWKLSDSNSMGIAVAKDLNKLLRKQTRAINIVMDLHRPKQGKKFCKTCGKFYPCSTIQALEEELT